jgi:hypothetical protein
MLERDHLIAIESHFLVPQWCHDRKGRRHERTHPAARGQSETTKERQPHRLGRRHSWVWRPPHREGRKVIHPSLPGLLFKKP